MSVILTAKREEPAVRKAPSRNTVMPLFACGICEGDPDHRSGLCIREVLGVRPHTSFNTWSMYCEDFVFSVYMKINLEVSLKFNKVNIQ